MIDTVVIVYDQAYISGGAAKIAIGEAVALKEKGYNVIYFSALDPIDKALKEAGVEVICIGGEHIASTKSLKALSNGLWNSNAKKKLIERLVQLDKEKTVVHIHGWTKVLSSSVFAACGEVGVKTFITLHEYFTICPNGGMFNYRKGKICEIKPNSVKCFFCDCDKRSYVQKMYRNVRQLFMRVTLRKLKPNVIYITEFSRNILEPYIDFVGESFFVENHVEIVEHTKVNVEYNADYLYIGRVSSEKAPDLFCEAVSRAGVNGIVIGDGPQLEELRRKYPQVQFTGWLSAVQMKKYLDKARCLVVSSKWYETMGLTILEMQAKGIPCIVPDQCAGSEYVDNNITGIIYKTGDVESLTNAIEIMNKDNVVSKMGDAFWATYDECRFSMQRHVMNLIDIFNR